MPALFVSQTNAVPQHNVCVSIRLLPQNAVVTICTTSFNTKTLHFANTACLRPSYDNQGNSDYLPEQRPETTDLSNGGTVRQKHSVQKGNNGQFVARNSIF